MKIEKQPNDELTKIGELVKRMKVGMLTTIDDAEGALRSRPMHALELDQHGCLWFFGSATSPKVEEAHAHSQEVNISFADSHKMDYLSISGHMKISQDRDKMKMLWSPYIKIWFPKGLDDPNLALLGIEIDTAEYWEAPGNAVKRLYGFAKALTTGDKSAIGDHEKIKL